MKKVGEYLYYSIKFKGELFSQTHFYHDNTIVLENPLYYDDYYENYLPFYDGDSIRELYKDDDAGIPIWRRTYTQPMEYALLFKTDEEMAMFLLRYNK